MRTTTRAALIAPLLLVPLVLGGCAPIVALEPANDAINPKCAQVIVALPETVADLQSRETDAQGTAAWGTPTGVILHCGVPVPNPTSTLQCFTVKGVDWLIDGKDAPNYVFTTYGRDPAVEVIVNSDTVSGQAALTDLAFAVSNIAPERACIAPEDTTK
ncbi:MAG: hypothetical protein JWP19_686 [Rhodoglobus sp.]|nr:hypothetical protein [Rhodoglobus sp.]